MTGKTTRGFDPIGIRWPISEDEFSKMDRKQLGDKLLEAQATYEARADRLIDLINKIGGPYRGALGEDFRNFMYAAQWQMVVGEHYVRRIAQHPKPDDRG